METRPLNGANIKAVYFDAAGTLITPARRVGQSYAVIAEKYGKEVTPRDLAERFRLCFEGAPCLAFPGVSNGDIRRLERDWWRTLVLRIFEPLGRFDRFEEYFAELFDYFAQPSAWALYTEVLETLAALKQRGLTLAVISNFDSRLVRILDGLGIGSFLTDVFISSQVGYAKPDPRIFEVALSRHGLRSADAIHIGDSETNDLHGARSAGLSAWLIDRESDAADHRLSSLQQIVAWFESSRPA